MWLPTDGRPRQCPVEVWEDKYAADSAKWLDGSGHAAEATHIGECMRLIGDVKGKDVLDLGGGALLCRAMREAGARSFTVVDYSPSACRIVQELGDTGICSDILEFLSSGAKAKSWFDVTVTFGVFDYLPPGSLDKLFIDAPSPVIVVGLPNGESYLRYATRTVEYPQKYVLHAAERYGWALEELEKERTSHTWARFRRPVRGIKT